MKDIAEKIKSLEVALHDLKQHVGGYDMREANQELEKEEEIENGDQAYSKTSDSALMKKQLLLKKMQAKG